MNTEKLLRFGDHQLWCIADPEELQEAGRAIAAGDADGICISVARGFSGSDLAFLSGLPELRVLAVTDAAGVDISSVSQLASLEYLAIDTAEGSIELQRLPRLVELRLIADKGRELPAAGLPSLRRLALWACKDKDLAWLQNYGRLEHLELTDARRLVTLDGVENAAKLEALSVSYCPQLERIDAIGKLVGLRSLEFENVKKIRDYASLAALVRLRRLFIKKAGDLAGLDILQDLSGLESLVLREVRIASGDLSPLLKLPGLKHIHLDNKKEYEPLHGRLKDMAAERARQAD